MVAMTAILHEGLDRQSRNSQICCLARILALTQADGVLSSADLHLKLQSQRVVRPITMATNLSWKCFSLG